MSSRLPRVGTPQRGWNLGKIHFRRSGGLTVFEGLKKTSIESDFTNFFTLDLLLDIMLNVLCLGDLITYQFF